ncbi:MAG: hypothetical protein ING65_17950 [Rhodocyclaceae bacterium]|jgi:hypothetical protein|nr:hypothetical protein [Rhodocyclaceae bacterium]
MKNITLFLIASAITLASTSAYAQSGTVDTYCGSPIFGAADLDTDAPLVEGIVVNKSTNTNVQQVIGKFGKHTLEFNYEDMPHIRRTAIAVSAYFQNNHAATELCLDAKALELSKWGTPLTVLPGNILQ